MYIGQVIVRFGDIDQAGIVYYPRFFHYFHMVYEDWLQDRVVPLPELLRERRIGFPVVSLTANFKSPLRYGDICPVELTLTRLGGSSASFRYRIYKHEPKGGPDFERNDPRAPRVLAAEAAIVTACMDLETATSTLIPDDIRALLERSMLPPDDKRSPAPATT